MKKTILVKLAALLSFSLPAAAFAETCPSGYYYDSGKVTCYPMIVNGKLVSNCYRTGAGCKPYFVNVSKPRDIRFELSSNVKFYESDTLS